MFNRLCTVCVHTCKQSDHAKIMRCPRFQRKVSEREFRRMIDSMDDIDTQAHDLSARSRRLVELSVEYSQPVQSDENPI